MVGKRGFRRNLLVFNSVVNVNMNLRMKSLSSGIFAFTYYLFSAIYAANPDEIWFQERRRRALR